MSGGGSSAAVAARLREVEREIIARRPEHAINPSLDRIRALVTLLGDPQRAYPVIHITGTNGKTSTARMAETLLRARGLRTGLFTSPHLTRIQERICVDGEPLSAEQFIAAYDEIRPYLDLVDASGPVPLSFFEVLVGMAFSVFADAPVDVAVIEVGMGGTWDNTNVADGTVAVVTPISIDHARYLGSTVEAIAADKAGIIKPGAVAVLAQQPLPAAEALLRRAAVVGASVAREGLEFGVLSRELAVGGQLLSVRSLLGDYDDLFLPLFGAYQAGNLACAIAAVEAFAGGAGTSLPAADDRSQAGWPAGAGPAEAGQPAAEARTGGDADAPARGLPEAVALDIELVRQAVAAMTSPGRLEIVRRSPLVIVDAAHNPAGMAATVEAVAESFTFAEMVAILAVAEDKDVPGILDELEPAAARLVVTRNSSSRSMDPVKLGELAISILGPDRVLVAPGLDEAIELGVRLADEIAADSGRPASAGLLVTGSVITAGDARRLLLGSGEASARAGRARGGFSGRDGGLPDGLAVEEQMNGYSLAGEPGSGPGTELPDAGLPDAGLPDAGLPGADGE